jgi:hypothetical protein
MAILTITPRLFWLTSRANIGTLSWGTQCTVVNFYYTYCHMKEPSINQGASRTWKGAWGPIFRDQGSLTSLKNSEFEFSTKFPREDLVFESWMSRKKFFVINRVSTREPRLRDPNKQTSLYIHSPQNGGSETEPKNQVFSLQI